MLITLVLFLYEDKFHNLTDTEKKALGAFWAFIFKEVFGYQEKKNVSISTCSVKTAAYSLNPKKSFFVEKYYINVKIITRE